MPLRPISKKPYAVKSANFTIREKCVTLRRHAQMCRHDHPASDRHPRPLGAAHHQRLPRRPQQRLLRRQTEGPRLPLHRQFHHHALLHGRQTRPTRYPLKTTKNPYALFIVLPMSVEYLLPMSPDHTTLSRTAVGPVGPISHKAAVSHELSSRLRTPQCSRQAFF